MISPFDSWRRPALRVAWNGRAPKRDTLTIAALVLNGALFVLLMIATLRGR